jgi:tRNA(Ile2) C34 agmatinyltransferase TiaS
MIKRSSQSVAQGQAHADHCHRCGGLMVSEPVHELASHDWRCVSCGERIDPVILAHRRQTTVEPESGHSGTRQRQFSLS